MNKISLIKNVYNNKIIIFVHLQFDFVNLYSATSINHFQSDSLLREFVEESFYCLTLKVI